MSLFTRMSNGWQLTLDSCAVLKENRQLILFPVLSGISMLLIISSFVAILLSGAGWDWDALRDQDTTRAANYAFVFCYYLVNYFVIVFFNTALVHCTHLYFNGEKPTVGQGLRFALTRVGTILAWAVFAATVGTILRAIQDKLGNIGKFITGLIGIVWSIATFFVVPVLAYEDLGPLAAFRRSASLMKQKWGESLASSFSFAILQFLAILALAIPSVALGAFIHPLAGVALFAIGIFAIIVLFSAVKMIFVSAVYHNINGDPVRHFKQQFADNLFVEK
ncbi:MAG TPA: DUF6159 family protein [Puia sp.]|nr:DUF6159 family protein [Puia sp.]